MINRDWEKFGEDIRKTVQDAIDAQDFGKLNQTITNTINNAVDSVSRNIRNAQEAQQFQSRGRGPVNRSFGSQDTVRGRDNRRNGHLGQEYGYGSGRKKQLPVLYRKPAGVQVGGTLTTVFGAVAGSMFSVALVFFVITALMAGAFGIPEIMVTALFLIFAVAGFVAFGCGAGIQGRVKRFRTYVQVLGMREYCNIRELSEKVHKSVKFVVKDLEYMFAKGWFLEGHLDDEKTCLITSHGMYQQYKQIQADRRVAEQEKAAKQQRAEDESIPQNNRGTEGGHSKLPPEVQKVVDEGDAYIRKIHACNDAISGAEISAKISHMEMLVDKIFDRVEQEPEAVDDIRRLMEYYLPTTVKLLEAYRELDAQPVDGENIRSSKREIEETLDTLNMAFEKLLDGLFKETAWDVSSDISVLHTLLAQEGLMDDGLHKPR
ncbi:MAG: hypothetical protein HFG81_13695 [Dorea sp.]|uniref:5-bromo-4-chloroindolyl phosphate hydrolysis family protein n=1 Tax=Sporofaciens musculi TaxID=2681861 RepID=UPI0021727455|nr:5-bromo-4-chloroindolyl phosphate hydrolysis family protein [Sporofaciens musculi]MCI9423738.1 hypothetical protein [Dorea sp.]